MENDDKTVETQDVITEGQPDVVEETTPEASEAPSEPQEPRDDGIKLSPAEFRHYKKWKDSQKEPQKVQPQQVSQQPDVDERILVASGMPDELLGELKVVAKLRNVDLIKAQNDPIFVAVKEKFEKDKKQRDASLGASRGSGSVKAKKDFNTPGLSREEHRKMFLDTN